MALLIMCKSCINSSFLFTPKFTRFSPDCSFEIDLIVYKMYYFGAKRHDNNLNVKPQFAISICTGNKNLAEKPYRILLISFSTIT